MPSRKKTDVVRYSLVIKGQRVDAEAVCLERGLDATFARTVNDVTVMETDMLYDRSGLLVDWLAEMPKDTDGGFPPGTLLLYTPHPQETKKESSPWGF